MPTYHYQARRADGSSGDGVVEASGPGAAVAQIRRSYDVVLSLQEIPARHESSLTRLRKLNLKMFALMCRQFSIILKAGLPLVQAVDLVASQMTDRALQALLAQVSEDIAGGWSLSASFSQRGAGRLPQAFLETLRSGEESGDLPQAFARLSAYYGRMTKTRAKAVSALVYPAFLSVMAVVVVIVIMTFAVPTFARTFESMGIELPLATRAVGNAHLSQQILSVLPGVEEGQSLGECLRRCPDLPPMLVQMTAMGEATGSLEATLEIQAEYYDSEAETLTTRAVSLLEPVIICIMALIVLVILLSIYGPMFTMYGAI